MLADDAANIYVRLIRLSRHYNLVGERTMLLLPDDNSPESIKALWFAWMELVKTLADNDTLNLSELSQNLSNINWRLSDKEDEKVFAQQINDVIGYVDDLISRRPSSDDRFHTHVLRCIEQINIEEKRLAQQADLLEIYDDMTDEQLVRALACLYKAQLIVADVVPAAIEFKNIGVHPTR